MNVKFSKNTVAVVLLSLGVVGSASAATFGQPVEASAEFNITKPTEVVHSLTPVANLTASGVANNDGTDLAIGKIDVTPNVANFAVRMKNYTTNPMRGTAVNVADSTITIPVAVIGRVGGSDAAGSSNGGWMVHTTPSPQASFDYVVAAIGSKSVVPGSYQITTEATTWAL
ncbi:TPA: hypothetical protein ACG0BA_004008 [Serratia odorifera]